MTVIQQVGNRCTGCACCSAVCPTKCIDMKSNNEGFLSPQINTAKCINCELCIKRCPVLNFPTLPAYSQLAYATYSKDEENILQSSSGGLFSALSYPVLKKQGVVYGTILNEANEAVIVKAEKNEELIKMRGSKYVQSSLSKEIYNNVKQNLICGKEVLFTGCPCQVAGIRSFLNKDYPNFHCVDIVCHGVPSPLLFKTYLQALSKKENSPITDYKFRNKLRGWGKNFSYNTQNKKHVKTSLLDSYQHNFFNGNTFRESCYQCPFACKERQGDITLGDYWGILQEHPEFYHDKGVSMLLVNTEKGQAMLDNIKSYLQIIPSTFKKISKHNINLLKPSFRPAKRDGIYNGITTQSANDFISQKLTISNSLPSLLKAMLPVKFKTFFQKIIRILKKRGG